MKNTSLLIALLMAAGIAAQAANCPVVNWGSDFGSGFMRGKSASVQEGAVDVDGDGDKSDDSVSCYEFSLDTPLNPPGLCYDTDAPSATFYGGMTLYTANNKRGISEGHHNTNHEGRDDLNFMANFRPDIASNEMTEGYALIVWQKDDFLNQGDEKTVTFSDDSSIDVHISRYWAGVDAGHWVVRDGDQFYVSEKIFGDLRKQFLASGERGEDGGNNIITRTTHSLNPADSKWAVYNPSEPWKIDFDYQTADFQPREFKDVTAVGFLITRALSPTQPCASGLKLGEPIGVKWYAFRCVADVQDVDPMNRLLSMKPVSGTDGTPLFAMSDSEITYEQWQTIRRNYLSNQLVLPGGENPAYIMEHGDGQMGSMILCDGEYSADHPVSNISWVDAVAFCNALSEYEGLTPCYYEDTAHTQVLRQFRTRSNTDKLDDRAVIYWNKDADGYRLPTSDEWLTALADSAQPAAAKQTRPVKSAAANRFGLYDMLGNVWEYVWDEGSEADPESIKSITVIGGDYRWPKKPSKTDLPFAENAFDGSHRIGFRVVRNLHPKAPVLPAATASATKWKIARDEIFEADNAMSLEELQKLITDGLAFVSTEAGGLTDENAEKFSVSASQSFSSISERYPLQFGATEIPYSIWVPVKLWAENNGYTFNYAGDMGSMAAQVGEHKHSPDEPVTMVSWYDSVIWCNALSEIMGKKPVYYADSLKTEPLKRAIQFRLETHLNPGYPQWPSRSWPGYKPDTESWCEIHVNAEADGYRIPLLPEYAKLTMKSSADAQWLKDNAGGTTHPVGTLAPVNGLYDMEGNVMEWVWDKRDTGFGSSRQLGHFANGYRKDHNNLDRKDFPFAAKSYCGFRACHR